VVTANPSGVSDWAHRFQVKLSTYSTECVRTETEKNMETYERILCAGK
jgi:hypothetical protein